MSLNLPQNEKATKAAIRAERERANAILAALGDGRSSSVKVMGTVNRLGDLSDPIVLPDGSPIGPKGRIRVRYASPAAALAARCGVSVTERKPAPTRAELLARIRSQRG